MPFAWGCVRSVRAYTSREWALSLCSGGTKKTAFFSQPSPLNTQLKNWSRCAWELHFSLLITRKKGNSLFYIYAFPSANWQKHILKHKNMHFFLHFLQDKRPKLDFFPLGRGIWWCPSLLVRNSMDRPGVLYTGPGDWAGHWEAELQRWPRGRVGAVTHDLLFNRDVLMAVAWLTFPHQSYHRGGCLLFFSKRIKFSNIL